MRQRHVNTFRHLKTRNPQESTESDQQITRKTRKAIVLKAQPPKTHVRTWLSPARHFSTHTAIAANLRFPRLRLLRATATSPLSLPSRLVSVRLSLPEPREEPAWLPPAALDVVRPISQLWPSLCSSRIVKVLNPRWTSSMIPATIPPMRKPWSRLLEPPRWARLGLRRLFDACEREEE